MKKLAAVCIISLSAVIFCVVPGVGFTASSEYVTAVNEEMSVQPCLGLDDGFGKD